MSERPAVIDRAWIENHIPHQGSMCLLDRVEHWDAQQILCIAHSHAQADNPLRSGDSLGVATAIEYAAQATAIHSALLIGNDGKLGAGFLASVRNVQWHHPRIDDAGAQLCVRATRLSGNEMTVLYTFVITAGAQFDEARPDGAAPIVEGRISIFLDSAAAQPLSAGLERLS